MEIYELCWNTVIFCYIYLLEKNIHSLVAADPEDRSKEENIPQTQHD